MKRNARIINPQIKKATPSEYFFAST